MGLGFASTPCPLPKQPGQTQQPQLLLQGSKNLLPSNNPKLLIFRICHSLSTTKSSSPKLLYQSCNRWVRKCFFLYSPQDFPALWCCIHNTHTHSSIPCETRPIWKTFQNMNGYIHSSCPAGATPMSKVFPIPIATQTPGQQDMAMLARKLSLCFRSPDIFLINLLQVNQLKRKIKQSKTNQPTNKTLLDCAVCSDQGT